MSEYSYTREECIEDTKQHITNVQGLLLMFAAELVRRAEIHDASKLESPELEKFVEYTPKLRNTTYGSDEYKKNLDGLGEALKHHYEHNDHHPEHFKNGVDDMNLVQIVEMFCDWKAASLRHNDGNIIQSIDVNKERFKLSPQLEKIFKNSARFSRSSINNIFHNRHGATTDMEFTNMGINLTLMKYDPKKTKPINVGYEL